MKVLFDTSVLVAAMVYGHPDHPKSFPWLEKAVRGDIKGFVAGHTLAELYAVLSSLPVRPRLSPGIVLQLIETNVISTFTIMELSRSDYLVVLSTLAKRHMAGGVTYDGLIAHAAIKAGVDILLTLNPADFNRLLPGHPEMVRSPRIS